VKLLNAFGGAEELEGSASYGMRTSHTYRLALSAPITASMLTRGELSTYSVDNDYNLWASCREGQKGVRAAISVRAANFTFVDNIYRYLVGRHTLYLAGTNSRIRLYCGIFTLLTQMLR
jgi:hypothetical protein